MKTRNVLVLVVLGASQVACGHVDEPEASVGSSQSIKISSAVVSSSTVRGYVHSLSASKFRIGDSPWLEADTPHLKRWRGSLGAFATDPTTGWSMAEINSDTPRGPYMTDDAAENSLVVEYLTTAGLPSDQIGRVGNTYQMTGGGDLTVPATTGSPPLTSVITSIGRRVNGIDVPDSYAWVKMTTSGQVDAEAVFWPDLDLATVNAAVTFKQRMADVDSHSAFTAKLGHVYRDAGVVIRHSNQSIHGTPTTYVSYDAVVDEAPTSDVRHFDQSGVEFHLPQEQHTGTPTPRPVPTQ